MSGSVNDNEGAQAITGETRDGHPGWDSEGDAEYIAGVAELLPIIEDDYERWGWEEFLQEFRAWQRRRC